MVALLITSSIDSPDNYNDQLAGGGIGADLGVVSDGAYAPLIDKVSNTGQLNVFVRHDGNEPIQDVKLFIGDYTGSTDQIYGGSSSSQNDFDSILSLGANSGSSKNNQDGHSSGLWVDFNPIEVNNLARFDRASRPTEVRVFGDSGAGSELSRGIPIAATAMVFNDNGIAKKAVTPFEGTIGVDSNLGTAAFFALRIYIPKSSQVSGTIQLALNISYSFTA